MIIWIDNKIFGLNKKTINEIYESRKQFKKELEEFRKITESLIRRAERLGLIDKEQVKDLKKEYVFEKETKNTDLSIDNSLD